MKIMERFVDYLRQRQIQSDISYQYNDIECSFCHFLEMFWHLTLISFGDFPKVYCNYHRKGAYLLLSRPIFFF